MGEPKVIKNDPKTYVTRASMVAAKVSPGPPTRTAEDFANAKIDERLYFTFPVPPEEPGDG